MAVTAEMFGKCTTMEAEEAGNLFVQGIKLIRAKTEKKEAKKND